MDVLITVVIMAWVLVLLAALAFVALVLLLAWCWRALYPFTRP